MTPTFRVTFKGEMLPGVDHATALAAATKRLKATPEQMAQVFAGRVAVLAKGASLTLAQRYVDELSNIGLIGRIEEENAARVVVTPNPAAAPAPAPALKTPETFDAEKTLIASPETFAAIAANQESPPAQRDSTIERSRQHLSKAIAPVALGESSRHDEPTIVVPRRKIGEVVCHACGEIQPMGVHCRRCGDFLDPGAAPTILVPRNEIPTLMPDLTEPTTIAHFDEAIPDASTVADSVATASKTQGASRARGIALAIVLILVIAVVAYQMLQH